MFKLRGEISHVKRNRQSNSEVKRSKVKVTGTEKARAVYRIDHRGRTCFASRFKGQDTIL